VDTNSSLTFFQSYSGVLVHLANLAGQLIFTEDISRITLPLIAPLTPNKNEKKGHPEVAF
jgi:hypothetical protein